jgi:VWFA-related protein
MKKYFSQAVFYLFFIFAFSVLAEAQNPERKYTIKTGGTIEVENLFGRIDVRSDEKNENQITIQFSSDKALSANEIKTDNSDGKLKVEILPANSDSRVDVTLQIPIRIKVRLKSNKGQIRVSGDFEEASAESNTGTIYADIPVEDLKYKFLWSASRPRIVSDVELEDYKEKAAGKFVIKGEIKEESQSEVEKDEPSEEETKSESGEEPKDKGKQSKTISLDFRTARGIILLNVPPSEVPSDLTERPLTDAAKAVIRSGDSLLTEAIRRASPKFFGDYASTLPPRKNTPFLNTSDKKNRSVSASLKKVNVQVVDINNRAVSDLSKEEFQLTERGDKREIISVEPATSPFNLVLLLDVSGSIENYVDFIRKAARNFVRTVSPQDKLSIVIFNEDVKTLSAFTTDKDVLSESLDTFDAGGGTAYYDSIAYVLTDTLRPMKGDRTAIVVLSDGDDNRSFLPFSALLGSIQESGALVYPLYVPSGLIAASETRDINKTADPLRNRFLSQSLTSKAQEEGEELARISGGVYYPISRLSELQTAYDDIVRQLRTAYTITYRSNLDDSNGDRTSPLLKVKVNRENTFVKLGTVVAVRK